MALGTLGGWSAEARAGRGRLVLVGGEAGVGKTSLVNEFALRQRPVAQVLWGGRSAAPTRPPPPSPTATRSRNSARRWPSSSASAPDPWAAAVIRRLRELGVRGLARGPRPSTRANPANLTARELEVLRLLVEGRSNRQIAEQLFISNKTAGVHVTNLLAKLGVHSRLEAAAMARRLGLDQPAELGS